MYANEFETKEKQKLTEIKNKLQHIRLFNLSAKQQKLEHCNRRVESFRIKQSNIHYKRTLITASWSTSLIVYTLWTGIRFIMVFWVLIKNQ